jgi:hypothetical protein
VDIEAVTEMMVHRFTDLDGTRVAKIDPGVNGALPAIPNSERRISNVEEEALQRDASQLPIRPITDY